MELERERKQNQQDLERLEELKQQEMQLVEANLKSQLEEDHQLKLKKLNKEKSLIQVL